MLVRRILIALLCAGFSWASAAAQPDKVRVGVFSSISDAGLYVALDKGYFAEQSIEPEFVRVDSAATVNSELASGNLDVAGGSPGAGVYNAVRQGIPLKIVADKGSSLPGHGYFAFVVRKDLADAIKTPADLKGRSFGVTGYGAGASSEVTVNRLLKQGGLTEDDVNITNLRFADVLASLGTGRIDVGVLIEPLVTQAEERDIGKIWKRVDEIYPGQQYAAVMYGPGIVKRPDVAKRFMVAYLQGARFYNEALQGKAPSQELVSILTKHTSVKNPELYDRMTFPGLNPNGDLNTEGMESDMKWWVSVGRMKEPVPVANVVDTSYIEYAIQQLGPYQAATK